MLDGIQISGRDPDTECGAGNPLGRDSVWCPALYSYPTRVLPLRLSRPATGPARTFPLWESPPGCAVLPYLAHQLKKNTPKIKPKPAADSELFTFAQAPDWKERLDSDTLSAVSALLGNYDACLSRICANRVPIRDKQRKSDIDRILYARGQEDIYDSDELYALFQQMEPERIALLRQAVREQCWHFMDETNREAFLLEQLPETEFAAYYDLLSDFRFGGFRVLGDLVCDIDDTL